MTTKQAEMRYNISTEEGYKAALQGEINITLDVRVFPRIALSVEEWGILGRLQITLDDFILIDMGNAETLNEALALVAFHQQYTQARLFVERELAVQIGRLTDNQNTFTNEQGQAIDFTDTPNLH